VGHFAATRPLDSDWRTAIRARLDAGAPLLGICVGLQWLFEGSTEEPGLPGLGVFPGVCARLKDRAHAGAGSAGALKVPHVGWNGLTFPRPSRLFAGIPEGRQVYFTHSYAAPVVEDTVAVCEHGVRFSAAVERGAVSAVQFHPEKSGDVGLHVLRNWLRSVRDRVAP
jgi:glutamine amidotransferase